ncbi:hypothetical protein T07_4246 [Trichinella nelsoni]|uniref:Uncharacterized protein n=1 Tax=Trichinella nelsoni TaxID=6336 RepID=A0A0V0RS91_9BILA|nr:hypothetical protein T07_4246 [Trichinella nelsoni]
MCRPQQAPSAGPSVRSSCSSQHRDCDKHAPSRGSLLEIPSFTNSCESIPVLATEPCRLRVSGL